MFVFSVVILSFSNFMYFVILISFVGNTLLKWIIKGS